MRRANLRQLEPGRQILEKLAADDFKECLENSQFLYCYSMLADLCLRLKDPLRAQRIYELLAPHAGALAISLVGFSRGPADYYLGKLARFLGDRESGEAHLESAIEIGERLGARPVVARSRLGLAELLLASSDPDVIDRGARLLAEASAEAEALGMEGVHERAEMLKERQS